MEDLNPMGCCNPSKRPHCFGRSYRVTTTRNHPERFCAPYESGYLFGYHEEFVISLPFGQEKQEVNDRADAGKKFVALRREDEAF